MTGRRVWVGLLLALWVLSAAGCSVRPPAGGAIQRRVLLWHSWSANETAVLDQVINSFIALNPGVKVMHRAFADPAEMRAQFAVSAASGLGPDLLIVPAGWSRDLVAQGLIEPIDAQVAAELLARYAPAALTLLRHDDRLYGLPESLDTVALYYNQRLVTTPPATLDDLLAQANAGATVLLPINFYDAFWGIQAFGGRLFDESGRTILDQGGFANWLAWLRDARSAPGMIQDASRAALRNRFLEGNDEYYIGYASELDTVIEALGEANVGVALLPSGPVGAAAPLLDARAFVFSNVSSGPQRRIALELAEFVTNQEQSARLMRAAEHVPANVRVRINARLNPFVAVFAAQARAAVAAAGLPQFAAAQELGGEGYTRVLEGGESPADVAVEVANAINAANGFDASAAPSYVCTGLGTVTLALVGLSDADAAGMEAAIAEFRRVCPLIIVRPVRLEPADFIARLQPDAPRAAQRPTLAVVGQRSLPELVGGDPRLRNLTAQIAPEVLQRFRPDAVDALRVEDALYGLPLSLQVNALYVNRALIAEPVHSVDDFRTQAAAGLPIVLDTRFDHAFWGIGAFGGEVLDDQDRVILDQNGFAEWLSWLRSSRDSHGIRLSDDAATLRSLFVAGQSAYYVGAADELADLTADLGEDTLGVTLLPAGPGGPARPLVTVRGIVFRAGLTEMQFALALEFARYVTDLGAQQLLMITANIIPANTAVPIDAAAQMGAFVEQAQSGYLLPNTATADAVLRLGSHAFERVLDEGAEPATAIAEVTAAINRAVGVRATPTPSPTPTP